MTTEHGLRGTFEDLVADSHQSCTSLPVPNLKKNGHLEVSTSSQRSKNMRLCSRFENAFLRVERTLGTQQEYMCYSIVEPGAISYQCKQ